MTISCAQNSPQKVDDSSKPVVEISPISNSAAENNPFSTNEIIAANRVKILPPPSPSLFMTPKEDWKEKDWKDFWRKENVKYFKKFGFYDLKERQIAKDNLEIRVEQISGLFMRIYKNLGIKQSGLFLNGQTEIGQPKFSEIRSVRNQMSKNSSQQS